MCSLGTNCSDLLRAPQAVFSLSSKMTHLLRRRLDPPLSPLPGKYAETFNDHQGPQPKHHRWKGEADGSGLTGLHCVVSARDSSGTHSAAVTGKHLTGAERHEFSKEKESETWCLGPSRHQWDVRRLETPRGGVRDGVGPSMEGCGHNEK